VSATYAVSPVVSVDLNKIFPSFPKIAVAAGFRANYARTRMSQRVPFKPISVLYQGQTAPVLTDLLNAFLDLPRVWDGQDASVDLRGDGWGFGACVGVHWQVTDKLSVGASYQQGINLNHKGTADFHAPGMNPNVASLFFTDDDVSWEFAYPDMVRTGVAYTFSDFATVEFDFWYGNWANGKNLEILFANPKNQDMIMPQDWTNQFLFGLGVEIHHFDHVPIRFGGVYDMTPIPDSTVSPTIPDNNRPFILAGVGYHPEKWPFLIPEKCAAFVDFFFGVGWWTREKDNDFPPNIQKPLVEGTDLDILIDMEPHRANGSYSPVVYMIGLSGGLQF